MFTFADMRNLSRGKKIYRKFADDLEPEDPVWDDADTETSPRLRPLTRSSIKPRLLFPTSTQHNERSLANKEDEEAITDIEELPPLPNDSEMTDLAPETEDEPLVTPVKASFVSPATPPATGHATRSATKRANLQSSSPPVPETADTAKFLEHQQIKKLSPFDGWQRTKATAPGYASGKGRKRVGEPLDLDGGGSKRMKGNEV